MFDANRFLNTPTGRFLISVLLGLGLATMFRQVCVDGSCLEFNGPVIEETDGKTFQFGEYCYQYEMIPAKYDPVKKTIAI
jgi:hypothetical protein